MENGFHRFTTDFQYFLRIVSLYDSIFPPLADEIKPVPCFWWLIAPWKIKKL